MNKQTGNGNNTKELNTQAKQLNSIASTEVGAVLKNKSNVILVESGGGCFAETIVSQTKVDEGISKESETTTPPKTISVSSNESIPDTHTENITVASGPTCDSHEVVEKKSIISDYWHQPAVIAPNNFKYKSLSEWCYNTAIGCVHGCRFCYVPETSVGKQGSRLKKYGVNDPDAEWGDYILVREWDEKKFRSSLKAAEATPVTKLKLDGNRAVMYCSTTDPYQVIRHPDPKRRRELHSAHSHLVTRSLELIRDESTINVRILTRSPLAKMDFDLFKSFGDRLLFGMSLQTLNNKLARIYEPNAPSPAKRLETLQAARDAGLNVYVAVAPTLPDSDEADLRATLTAIRDLEPWTIFHEPINIRAENVERIRAQARALGTTLRTDVFETPSTWRRYAIGQLKLVETIAGELGIGDRLHLWPDKDLLLNAALAEVDNPLEQAKWLRRWHSRISEWPGKTEVGK